MQEADRMDKRERDADKAADAFAMIVKIARDRNERNVGTVPRA